MANDTHDEDRRLASDAHPDLPIEHFLGKLEDGRTLDDLERGLHEIIGALHRAERHGASKPKAKLSLALVFVMDRGVVDVQPTVTVATPKPRRGGTLFFATPKGRLVREDQVRQTELPGLVVESTMGQPPAIAPAAPLLTAPPTAYVPVAPAAAPVVAPAPAAEPAPYPVPTAAEPVAPVSPTPEPVAPVAPAAAPTAVPVDVSTPVPALRAI